MVDEDGASFNERLTGAPFSHCAHPWFDMMINAAGLVSCCPQNHAWLGNVREEAPLALWHGPKAQEVRRLIGEGRYQEAQCDRQCPYLRGAFQTPERHPPLREMINPPFDDPADDSPYARNLHGNGRAYRDKVVCWPGHPLFVDIQTTVHCNARCIMCGQPHHQDLTLPVAVLEGLAGLYPFASHFRWQGGEVFLYKAFSRYLARFLALDHPHLRAYIITNGSLLTPELLARLLQGKRPIFFLFSMDGASQTVFERVRQGLDFATVMANLEHLAATQRRLGRRDLVRWNYVVMKSTLPDMEQAMAVAERLGVDLNFAPVQGECPGENIFMARDLMEPPLPLLERLQRQAQRATVTISGFAGMAYRLRQTLPQGVLT